MPRTLTWLHLSDIHFLPKNDWRDCESRNALIEHLQETFTNDPQLRPDLIFCTGDIAFGETGKSSLSQQYGDAKIFFQRLLEVCGSQQSTFPKENLFLVPGNHDIARNSINSDAQRTLIKKATDASRFAAEINDRFSNKTIEFTDAIKRLESYTKFVADYLPHQIDSEGQNLYQTRLNLRHVTVDICGFNSAWSAAGPEDDRNLWLAALSQFNRLSQNISDAHFRIGLIHHPADWLNTADRKVATSRISTDFDFWLHGHSHDTWVVPTPTNITIGAGSIGAETSDEFGYNITILNIDDNYGQSHLYSKMSATGWTIHPIPGVAPKGVWKFQLPKRSRARQAPSSTITAAPVNSINNIGWDKEKLKKLTKILSDDLSYCTKSYSTQPEIWIEPLISKNPETSKESDSSARVEIDDILSNVSDKLIIAAPQFGLTCLARNLSLRACRDYKKLWLYIDINEAKPNKASLSEIINTELNRLEMSISEIECLLIDGGSDSTDFSKSIRILSTLFPHIPLLCLYQKSRIIDLFPESLTSIRKFQILHLWSLSRKQIRQIVSSYNAEKYVGEEDAVTARLSSDLEVLNLHRTPLNCLTLLKVSEVDFDENPVNRSEMIKRILFLIFNVDSIPTYKSRPDLKDCEFVLGFFCQQLIQRNIYQFSRSQFLSEIQQFCRSQLIDLEIHVVFDVLYANSIIVSAGTQFAFKFSYWILYFSAQRMHQDKDFADYIFSNRRYAQYPEIIEFYTGIDRKKDDALRLITGDMLAAVEAVKQTCGFPEDLNPYRLDIWKATDSGKNAMQEAVAEGVKESTLPDDIKDQFADANYDRTRPYNQKLANILTEHSVASMFQIIKAAARALRNSDYASPIVKRELLSAILSAWEQASKVILVILPSLSVNRQALIDGQAFDLTGDLGDTPVEIAQTVLKIIPKNVSEWFQDDLYSQKMSPLLLERLADSAASELSRHELALLIVQKRPKEWEKIIHKYISDIRKDSFYLLDIYTALRQQYSYGFASNSMLRDIEHLIKMAATKHLTGAKEPGVKAISKIKFDPSVLPERTSSADEAE